MVKPKKWNIEQKILILSMLFESKNLNILNEKDNFIENISQKLNKDFAPHSYDNKAVMFQLKDIADLNRKYARANIFLSSIMENGKFNNFKKNPAFKIDNSNKKIGCILILNSLDEESHSEKKIEVKYNIGLNIQSNIENIANLNNISELEAYCLFIKNNDLLLEKDEIVLHKNHAQFINTSLTNNLNNRNNQNLNVLISEVGKAFDHDSKYNLLPFNDPTGTGKTYSVLNQFIDKYKNCFETNKEDESIKLTSKRKNMYFVAPLKNQLTPDNNIYTLAENNNIPLLFLRSLKDLSNLNNKILLKNPNGNSLSYLTNNDFWKFLLNVFDKRIIDNIDKELKKLKQNSLINEDEEEYDVNYSLPQLSKLKLAYNVYLNFDKNNHLLKSANEEEYKNELEKAESFFRNEMQNIANLLATTISDKDLQDIFYTNALYKGLDNNAIKYFNHFGNNKYLYMLTYYLLMFALPIEVSKFVNCVIYLTGAKSQKTISFVLPKKNKIQKKIVNLEFEEIISGYQLSKDVDVLKYTISGNTYNFGDCIEKEMFKQIKGHFFFENKIGISLVYDEEHILHNLFTQENTYRIITEKYANSKVNILHAIAGIFRWNNNSNQQSLVNNYEKIVEEKTQLSKNFYESLKTHTKLKTDKDINEFLELIKDNSYGLFIKLEEFQFIKSLCQNVLSFNPKKIQSKEFIENISMVLRKNSNAILLTKNSQNFNPEEVKYNVFDFFQVCLCLMYVLRKSTKALRTEMSHNQEDNNQNLAISHLANISFNNKEFLDNLFSSSLNLKDTDPVSLQFTYFLTKIGFHFEFPKNININEYSPDSIAVEPQIFILKELPEVDILKVLHNPLNRVFLLSATRGFDNIYAGNFSLNFFNEINSYVPNKIRIYDRKKSPEDCLEKLIEERASFRDINLSHLNFFNNYSHNNKTSKNDVINEVLYPVKDISISNLMNLTDFAPQQLSYDLIKNNGFNTSRSWVSKLKNTSLLKNMWNVYNKDELINILNSIIHSIECGKNSMIISLSNRFYHEIIKNEEVQKEIFGQCKKIGPEGQENKILEIPIDSSKKLKIIFYDSDLGKTTNLDDAFILETGKITVIVSSFNSAGTGLNFTLQDKVANISKDFDSLYFVNSMYYTSINGDDGFNTWSNQLLIMKNYAHKGNKTIKDLEDAISSTEGRITLETEHFMEQVKTFMQAVGRIERRNTPLTTNIHFVDGSKKSLFREVMSLFNITLNKHKNNYQNTIISNFSMLAKAVLKTSYGYVQNIVLNNKERNILEQVTNKDFSTYNDFFCNPIYYPKLLKEYRNLHPDYYWVKEFNSIFREYISPQYDLVNELTNFVVKNEIILRKINFYQPILGLIKTSEFNFLKNNVTNKNEISIDYTNHKYTDFSQNHNVVSDAYFFNYFPPSALDLEKNIFLNKIMMNYSNFSSNSISKLPNIYLGHLIKGNLGEKVLEEYFNTEGIMFNNIDKLFSQNIAQKIYELFDFYVVKNNVIYCIDTKNWRMYNDNAALKTLTRLPDKIAILSQIKEFKGYRMEYIYLNMFPLANTDYSNRMSLFLGNYKEARFINFLEKEVVQSEVYKKQKNKNSQKKLSHYKREDGKITISKEWRNTL